MSEKGSMYQVSVIKKKQKNTRFKATKKRLCREKDDEKTNRNVERQGERNCQNGAAEKDGGLISLERGCHQQVGRKSRKRKKRRRAVTTQMKKRKTGMPFKGQKRKEGGILTLCP